MKSFNQHTHTHSLSLCSRRKKKNQCIVIGCSNFPRLFLSSTFFLFGAISKKKKYRKIFNIE